MPLYYFYCPDCKLEDPVLSTPKAVAKLRHHCTRCDALTQRVSKPATSRVVETLDNGVMSRSVERPADAERLFKERAVADLDRIKNSQ